MIFIEQKLMIFDLTAKTNLIFLLGNIFFFQK